MCCKERERCDMYLNCSNGLPICARGGGPVCGRKSSLMRSDGEAIHHLRSLKFHDPRTTVWCTSEICWKFYHSRCSRSTSTSKGSGHLVLVASEPRRNGLRWHLLGNRHRVLGFATNIKMVTSICQSKTEKRLLAIKSKKYCELKPANRSWNDLCFVQRLQWWLPACLKLCRIVAMHILMRIKGDGEKHAVGRKVDSDSIELILRSFDECQKYK